MPRTSRALAAATLIAGVMLAATLHADPPPQRPSSSVARAEQAYLAYCGMCHGPRGAGDGEVATALRRSNIVVPRLDNAKRLESIGHAGVLRIILEGGAHLGRSNVMPEWRGLVGEDLANDLADYVMSIPENASTATPGLDRYLEGPPGAPGQGRKLYVFHCSACHGPQGRGNGPSGEVIRRKHGIRPRDLTDTRFMSRKSDRDLYTAVARGGAHVGRSAYMPPWSNDLSPAQIKDLVAYLRQISRTRSRP